MRLNPPMTELPRLDGPIEDTSEPGWVAIRNQEANNVTGLNTGLVDGGFFLVDEQGDRIVGSDQGSSLNEGIRGVNSGNAFIDRKAKVRIPGSDQVFFLRITGNRGGHVIHADGRVVPELRAANGAKALVRLVGWADFGRDATFYQRREGFRRRYVREPQPAKPQPGTFQPTVIGPITGEEVIVDEGGGEFEAPVEQGDPIPGTF